MGTGREVSVKEEAQGWQRYQIPAPSPCGVSEKELSTSFDHIARYAGELRAQLLSSVGWLSTAR